MSTECLIQILTKDSKLRRPTVATSAVLGLALVAAVGFWLGSVVKNNAAVEAGRTSSGTQVASLSAREIIADRVSENHNLSVGIAARDNGLDNQNLAWSKQAVALIPRAIYPSKPTLDYGQAVTTDVFNSPSKSSSTVTFLGDIYIEFGRFGIAPMALVYAIFFGLVSKAGRQRGLSVSSLMLICASVVFITQIESNPVLAFAGTLRNLLISTLLWWFLNLRAGGKRLE